MEGISVLKKGSKGKKEDLYHVIHKVPYGDTPYVKAKHAQVGTFFLISALLFVVCLINMHYCMWKLHHLYPF